LGEWGEEGVGGGGRPVGGGNGTEGGEGGLERLVVLDLRQARSCVRLI
jgi:hypothetical protein